MAIQPTAKSMASDIKIPGYNIKNIVGRGGMATVYLAIQESFGRDVALKVLAPQHADESFSERFLREARIISRLVHPNIVTVYDVGVHEGYHYLSMEFVPGKDLKQAHETISRKQSIQIVKEVAKALDYAGKKGYVHRDIKPENIMLHEDGRVILMDFGIARGHDTTKGMTQTGKAIGTPYYMSPEQSKGIAVDPRSDIYSLGIVLYQQLAGFVPYDAQSAVAVCIKHVSAPIPSLPGDLVIFQPIINACLSKDPDHRYQTAGELIKALDQVNGDHIAALKTKPTSAKPANIDHNAATLMGSSIHAVANRTTSAYSQGPSHTAITTTSDFRRLKRRSMLLIFLLLMGILAGVGYMNQHVIAKAWQDIQHWYANITSAGQQNTVIQTLRGDSPTNTADQHASPQNQAPISSDEVTVPTTENIQESTTTTNIAAIDSTLPSTVSNNLISAESIKSGTPFSIESQENIQKLHDDLENSPENASILAKRYKDILRQQPDNSFARQGMVDLRIWYMQSIHTAINNKNLAHARELIDRIKQSFPRAAINERFIKIEEKLFQEEKIQSYLQKAKSLINTNALVSPPGANALEELHSALVIDPEHIEVRQTMQIIADTFYKRAKQQQAKGDFKNAIASIDSGLHVINNDASLLKLRNTITTAIKKQETITGFINQAEQQLRSNNLIQPKGKSAYNFYQAVLIEDPRNAKAKAALNKIELTLVNNAIKAIQAEQFEKATTLIKSTQKYYGQTSAINSAQQKLALAIEATLPKVTQIIFSDTNLTTLQDERPEKLSPGRTLYIGFQYKNFGSEATLLQAILLDGAGKVQIAQKPVIVLGETGDHFFDIELPVDGFAGGSYNLELLLGDKRLANASFLVNNLVQP